MLTRNHLIIPTNRIDKNEIQKAYDLVDKIENFQFDPNGMSYDDGEISLSVVKNEKVKIIATTGQFFGTVDGEIAQQIFEILEKNNFYSINYAYAAINCFD